MKDSRGKREAARDSFLDDVFDGRLLAQGLLGKPLVVWVPRLAL